jgi:hypothetical protein
MGLFGHHETVEHFFSVNHARPAVYNQFVITKILRQFNAACPGKIKITPHVLSEPSWYFYGAYVILNPVMGACFRHKHFIAGSQAFDCLYSFDERAEIPFLAGEED